MIIKMKKTILVILFLFLNCISVNASEITGKISTNMKPIINNGDLGNKSGGEENNNSGEGSDGGDVEETANTESQGSGQTLIQNQISPISTVIKKEKPEEIKVLGVSDVIFDDGMLVRSSNMKVYIIEKGMRRYISGMIELAKYRGQEIFNVDNEDLNKYKMIEKKYRDGELIRGFGEEKVYVIKNGVKRHIVSYEELKKNYFGLEIFNISQKELDKY